jgi:hypothetical protein
MMSILDLQIVSALHMFIEPKTHFFLLFKVQHIMALQTIQNVLSSCYFHLSPIAYDVFFSSSLFKSSAAFI